MKFITVIAVMAVALGVAFDFGLTRFDLAFSPHYAADPGSAAAMRTTETAMAVPVDAEIVSGRDGVLPQLFPEDID